ncbi:Uncharacterized protein TCAP_03900 [Tolypocladium capitatum]|uniref:Dol-P-Man:Man(5)GlcNAc(2)-PP-Dol alpha-1,3-mannosyltransferase n=1 Tax=Tolypocladium capitatum TaxID=45235 RepID=A0A2K3QF44_9HYPO|nr:Uncharacterized protein TCAP_03900 [Tolypocladium capitatum]
MSGSVPRFHQQSRAACRAFSGPGSAGRPGPARVKCDNRRTMGQHDPTPAPAAPAAEERDHKDKHGRRGTMSKLSPSLKALINAPFARPGPVAAPRGMADVYRAIARDAARGKLGARPWLAISTAATLTLNSPDALAVLYDVAAAQAGAAATQTAELMREVGLKCISFNGIPRTINCLNAFHASLPRDVAASLSTKPARAPTPHDADAGRRLWDSIYAPFEAKLVAKLARAHPDLPLLILGSHYGPLLADPPGHRVALGRVLTSAVAVACLRAQTGVAPQVLSHVFGLRKAWEDGTWRGGEEDEDVVRWLAGDEGAAWVLRTVDGIVEALGGSSFGNMESKL